MTINGWDQSHFQAVLTPARVGALLRAGHRHAGIKLSEGTYQTDPTFARNREALRVHAVPRWLYHEMRPFRDVAGSVQQSAAHQLDRIMAATGGHLYPRERLCLVLGDFSVPAADATELVSLIQHQGPVKRHRNFHRPPVICYANRSNWETVYKNLGGPKIVAAFGGPSAPVDCVIHQDSDHDSATGGDHDVWVGGQGTGTTLADLERFFLA